MKEKLKLKKKKKNCRGERKKKIRNLQLKHDTHLSGSTATETVIQLLIPLRRSCNSRQLILPLQEITINQLNHTSAQSITENTTSTVNSGKIDVVILRESTQYVTP